MKNLSKHTTTILLMAIAIGFTSCSDNGDDSSSDISATQAVEKTSVAFDVATNTSKLTGRDVKRGSIDAKVKSISITATKLWTNTTVQNWNYATSDVFNLISVGATGYSGAAEGFVLNDVAIGTNNFKASTEAAGDKINSWNTVYDSSNPNGDIQGDGGNLGQADLFPLLVPNEIIRLRGVNPYVIYNGEVLNKVIIKPEVGSTGNNITFNMTTNNGRINSIFNLGSFLVEHEYVVTVTAKGYITGQTAPVFTKIAVLDHEDVDSFQWSDDKSVAGSHIEYTIDIREQLGTPVLYTYVINDANTSVAASTSKTCVYTINIDKVLTNLVGADDITFTWQNWAEGATVNN